RQQMDLPLTQRERLGVQNSAKVLRDIIDQVEARIGGGAPKETTPGGARRGIPRAARGRGGRPGQRPSAPNWPPFNAPPSGPERARDFILADAKDADMALAIGAPGRSPEAHGGELRYRALAEYRVAIEQIVNQGLVDIMLMSASTSERLTIQKRIFDSSPVTP